MITDTHRAVPLSAVIGLSDYKLTTSKGAGTADEPRFEKKFRIGQSLSNRIKSDSRFEFESNLKALQVPRFFVILVVKVLRPCCD